MNRPDTFAVKKVVKRENIMTIGQIFCAIIVGRIIPVFSYRYNETFVDTNKFLPIDDSDKFKILAERVSEVLESCVDEEIVSIGVSTDTHFMHWTSEFLNVAVLVQLKYVGLMGTSLPQPPSYAHSPQPHKLDAFVMVASSPWNLQQMFNKLKISKWWNSSGLYVILDSDTVENGCSNAQTFLWISWKADLLSSVFFCHEPGVGFIMYTYNPFTDRAPDSWQKVRLNDRTIIGNTWNLYRQKLFRGRTKCGNLNFDKTQSLDGYKYKVIGVPFPPFFIYNSDEEGTNKYSGPDGNSLVKITHLLNVTWSSTIITNASYVDWIGQTGVAQEILSSVYTGTNDILINSQHPKNVERTALTYPLVESAIGILTRFAGYKTEEVKILEFMNPLVILGLLIIFVVTAFVLGSMANYGCMPGTLESIRIIVNTSVKREIGKDSLRIYLITVVILFLVTSAVMQSDLAAILTSPVPWANIVNLEDLKDSNLKIYCYRPFGNIFYDSNLAHRLILTDHWNCSNYVLEEEGNACTSDWYGLLKIAIDNDLFLSPKVSTISAGHVVRPDWPLTQRFNHVFGCLYNAGIMDGWRRAASNIFSRNWQLHTKPLNEQKIRKLKLMDVLFIFTLLIFGVIVSVLVFLVELTVFSYKNRKSRKARK